MKRESINPWTWQEKYGYVHANKVTDANTTLYLAGQAASDENGDCLHPGNMEAQLDQVFKNIDTILLKAEMTFTNIVRLNIYTIDMSKMMAAHDHMAKCLKQRGCQHAGSLLGVTALASPGALVEIEVTAVN